MAGRINQILSSLSEGLKPAWELAKGPGTRLEALKIWGNYSLAGKSSKDTRYIVGMAARGISGALTGAAAGAAWGAASDKESVVGGALKGAFVGAGAAVALRHFKPFLGSNKMFGEALKPMRNLASVRVNNIAQMRQNIGTAWQAMSTQKYRGMRNWVVGMGALGVARGMTSGEDNPIGGAIGGAVAGGIQGAALYAGYRGVKATGLLNKIKL